MRLVDFHQRAPRSTEIKLDGYRTAVRIAFGGGCMLIRGGLATAAREARAGHCGRPHTRHEAPLHAWRF
jgi:hypothetical protein